MNYVDRLRRFHKIYMAMGIIPWGMFYPQLFFLQMFGLIGLLRILWQTDTYYKYWFKITDLIVAHAPMLLAPTITAEQTIAKKDLIAAYIWFEKRYGPDELPPLPSLELREQFDNERKTQISD